MQDSHRYGELLATSERVAFRLDDVLAETAALDFSRPFLPEALTRVGRLSFLSASEQLVLNQICAHSYLRTFGLVEEFILPFVLDHARPRLAGEQERTRALLQFAGEEAKHIELFKRFAEHFERGFGSACEVVGPAATVADSVLSHAPLGVALAILHIEWMTQRHYLESVRGDQQLDPHFASLLKHHFIEECQHAKLDALIALELSAQLGADEIAAAVEDYFRIVSALHGLTVEQVELDLASFERARGRTLTARERDLLRENQRAASAFTYLGSGMSHPRFVAIVEQLSPSSSPRLRELSERFARAAA